MSTVDPVWARWSGVGTITLGGSTYTAYDPAWRIWWGDTFPGVTRETPDLPPSAAAAGLAALQAAGRNRARERAAAEAAARKLLLKCLNEEERHCFLEHRFFDVVGSDGRLYRIHEGQHGNVRLMEANPGGLLRSVGRYCAQPEGLPDADAVLAQALWLKHDAAGFLKKANYTANDERAVVDRVIAQAVGNERLFFNARAPTDLLRAP